MALPTQSGLVSFLGHCRTSELTPVIADRRTLEDTGKEKCSRRSPYKDKAQIQSDFERGAVDDINPAEIHD